MPDVLTADGRYRFVEQGDGNTVVYDQGRAIWDRWSYEHATSSSGGSQPPPDSGAPPGTPLPGDPPGLGPVAPLPPLGSGSAGSATLGVLQRIVLAPVSEGPFVNRGYSYWAQAFRTPGHIYGFVGHADNHPRFYEVTGDQVSPLGTLMDRFGYTGTAEGFYWTAGGNLCWIEGPRLHRSDPFSGDDEIVLDITHSHPGCDLWQAHSSDDGRTHSATIRQIVASGAYPYLGTVLQQASGQQQFFAADRYTLDESQVTADGLFLLIKSAPDDDNLLIDLTTGQQHWLTMNEGALGHSDCGNSLAIGADRANGQVSLIDFRRPLAAGLPLYHTWDPFHLALRGSTCLFTDRDAIYQLRLDGSGLNRLVNHGQQGDPAAYDNQVFANLSPDGSVVCYLVNGQPIVLVLG
jgi:hypothetical protein